MDSTASRESHAPLGFAPEEITVVNWPLRQEGWRAWLLLLLATGLVLLVQWRLESLYLSGAVAIVLILSLWRLWLPVQFEFRRHGIVQVCLGRRHRIPWNSIAVYRLYPSGVLLSPVPEPAPLIPLQGLFVAWGNKRAEILAHLKYYGEPAEAPAAPASTAAHSK